MQLAKMQVGSINAHHFFKFVKPDDAGCLIWRGPKSQTGSVVLPFVCDDGTTRELSARRLSAKFFGLEVPKRGLMKAGCGNRNCIHPDHIARVKGSPNSQAARGEQSGRSKITENDVREIRHRYASGETGLKLAAEKGITSAAVSFIIHRKTWAHVT